MSDGPVLGIDLGTTNSVVAVADGGQARVLTDPEGRRTLPSVVSFLPEGGTVVGYEARERRLVDAANTVYAIKRLIGRPYESPEVASARARFAFEIVPKERGGSAVRVSQGTFALAEISALVLRELRRVAELALGVPCERAVITVPASFNELQRSATKAAGKVAGLEVLRILNEPTAAALAYGCGGREHERVAVYDLGGGTFDITILELEDDVFEVLATDGDTHLGGEDMDRMIAEAMSERFAEEHGIDLRSDAAAFERLKAAAEWAKCQLSSEDAIELEIEELATARGRSLDLSFAMRRDELERLANPWLERSLEVCARALDAAGLSTRDLDNVVLVGGSTRMPRCRARVREHFGREPRSDIDPDLVVAQGAAIHGYALAGSSEPRTSRAGGGFAPRVAPRRPTAVGIPRQPAFAPDPHLRPAAPARPPTPDGPPPPPRTPVLVAPAIAVRTPRTTLDTTLDALAPPEEERESALDDLAPAPFSRGAEPLGDLVPDDPFAPPRPGGAPLGLPSLDLEPLLDAPFAPGERPVPSREPTAPFSIDKHAPRPKPPPRERSAAPPIPAPLPPPIHSPPIAIAPPSAPIPAPPAIAPPLPPPRPARDPVQTFALEAARPLPPPPTVALPERPPPLLMDVTPHSLGVETAGGYCRRLILKNAPVPTEQTRTFTTAQDDQREVVVRICQGEDDVFLRNEVLGEVVLDQLPPRRRGELTIEVAFILDVDGTLSVEARDAATGRGQRTSVNLRGGLAADEIDAMRARHERLA